MDILIYTSNRLSRYAHWCNTDDWVIGVTNYFLIDIEKNSHLVQSTWSNVHAEKGIGLNVEAIIFVLLNGHDVHIKVFINSYIYPFISLL